MNYKQTRKTFKKIVDGSHKLDIDLWADAAYALLSDYAGLEMSRLAMEVLSIASKEHGYENKVMWRNQDGSTLNFQEFAIKHDGFYPKVARQSAKSAYLVYARACAYRDWYTKHPDQEVVLNWTDHTEPSTWRLLDANTYEFVG